MAIRTQVFESMIRKTEMGPRLGNMEVNTKDTLWKENFQARDFLSDLTALITPVDGLTTR